MIIVVEGKIVMLWIHHCRLVLQLVRLLLIKSLLLKIVSASVSIKGSSHLRVVILLLLHGHLRVHLKCLIFFVSIPCFMFQISRFCNVLSVDGRVMGNF
jgi:hypothetical protein